MDALGNLVRNLLGYPSKAEEVEAMQANADALEQQAIEARKKGQEHLAAVLMRQSIRQRGEAAELQGQTRRQQFESVNAAMRAHVADQCMREHVTAYMDERDSGK